MFNSILASIEVLVMIVGISFFISLFHNENIFRVYDPYLEGYIYREGWAERSENHNTSINFVVVVVLLSSVENKSQGRTMRLDLNNEISYSFHTTD